MEGSAPEDTLKACVSSHSFFPFPFVPQSTSQFLEHHSVEGAITVGGATIRKGAGGEIPSPEDTWIPGNFQSSSSPEAPPLFGCSRLGFSAGGPAWIQRLGTQSQSKKHSRSIMRTHCLPHPPSSNSSTLALVPKPALAPGMWYQPRSPWPKGIELVFLMCFLFLLKMKFSI